MKAVLLSSVLSLALSSAALADGEPQTADPATIWDRAALFATPKSWKSQAPLTDGEVKPVWLEGEPYRGRPTRCFAYYAVPAGADRFHKVPAIVLIHGGDGTAYPEWVRLWLRRGYAAIAVDTCGAVPVTVAPDDGKAWGTWLRHPHAGPAGWGGFDQLKEPVRDQWVYHAVAAAVRSHSFLRSLEGVDAERIGVTGISWGGFLTCIVASLDTRLKYAVPVYGCGYSYLPHGLAERAAGKTQTADERLAWAQLWDPSRFLPYATCPFLWVDGTNDFAFPLDHVRRSAALVKGPSAFATRPRMIHSHGPLGEAPAEILSFADHYARGKADVPRFTSLAVSGGRVRATFTGDWGFLAYASAALLYTTDGEAVAPADRYWRTQPIEPVKLLDGSLETTLPKGAKAYFVNLTAYDGRIFSSPLRTVPEEL